MIEYDKPDLLPLEEALRRVLAECRPLPTLDAPLRRTAGRFLAEPLHAPRPIPHETASLMDGYAVRCADLGDTTPTQPLTVAFELPAGRPPPRPLMAGECARIFTGAPLPEGADAVVMQERARREGDQVRFDHLPQPGEHIRVAGSEAAAGALLLPAGTIVDAGVIALAAGLGCGTLPVRRQPRLAVLVTGDELAAPGEPLAPGQVYESNAPTLAALGESAGAEVTVLPPGRDDPASLQAAVRHAVDQADADVVVTSGGASVGDYDFARAVLAGLGGRRVFWQVAIRPGRPVLFGVLDGERPGLFFALPGNPGASALTFELLVRPALRAMGGAAQPRRHRQLATLTAPLRKPSGLTLLARGRLTATDGALSFHPAAQQGSMSVTSLVGANAVALLPPEPSAFAAGTLVPVEAWGPPEEA